MSAGARASQWNTLVVACGPYPAQFCLPGPAERKAGSGPSCPPVATSRSPGRGCNAQFGRALLLTP
eukprot:1063018-Alexandrium_andersonii.AAC.1